MEITKKLLIIQETYCIKDDDVLKIQTTGKTTHITINDKEINFVVKFKLKQKVEEYAELTLERYCIGEDFEEIEKM